ncbi:hypothetical protein EQG63_11155 [Flavobacterium amnicola]|uniref:RHS repeat-associated core domain-containing protein n=1 Tax=Flavobacterium amnicola TaxID=2506422 RepID=A0A4Q1K154_9FLAO|nr:RHS repeat-associated core domain-containing protein [Flavobacterium amnicola]RXR17339.1 hypothetical protein EQG63_11155 [Flavobacterium amnicola]
MKLKLPFAFIFLIINSIYSQKNFHDTQGKLEISTTGQAIYNIPIAMPASLQDVAPQINLIYASGQFGGIAGQGWNINSISTISRIGTRLDIDGFIDGVDYDDNDKLALDGQRLLLVSGTYWADGSIYQTEIKSNFRIELNGTGENIHFIITAPDGAKSWYGLNGAKDLNAYYISRFEDTNGNFINYKYLAVNTYNSLYIDEINFSANTNGLNTPLNTIKFGYKNALRKEKSFIKGQQITKTLILDEIKVASGNSLFRKYKLTHTYDQQLGYEKVASVQEFNGALEGANLIKFDYNNTVSTSIFTETQTQYNTPLTPDNGFVSGDFDGDGFVDLYNNGYIFTEMYQGGNGSSRAINAEGVRSIIPINTLGLNNKLNQFQSIASLENIQEEQITFNVRQINNARTGLIGVYSKTIQLPNYGTCYSNCPWQTCDGSIRNPGISTGRFINSSGKSITGDFNGDGISEILIIRYPEHRQYEFTPDSNANRIPDPSGNCNETYTIGDFPHIVRLLDMNPFSSVTLGTKGYTEITNQQLGLIGLRKDETITADFNGDGKTDVLVLKADKTYRVISFKQLLAAPWVEMEVIGSGTLSHYEKNKPLMLGDFNGDGKVDLITPVALRSPYWTIYNSNPNPNGGEFFQSETHFIEEYLPDTGQPGAGGGDYNLRQIFKNYYVVDTNKDGKSDIAVFRSERIKKEWWQYHNFDVKWTVNTYANNIGNNNAALTFTPDYASITDHYDRNPNIPFAIVANFKQSGANKEIIVARGGLNTVTYVNFTKNVAQDNLLRKVTSNGTNIIDEISYLPMDSVETDYGTFYTSSDQVNYPLADIKRISTNKLVSQLKNTTSGITKYQDFSYNGFIAHMHGLGALGFQKVARSSWYQTSGDKRIWNVTINDPLLRNAVKSSYSILNPTNTFSFDTSFNKINETNYTYSSSLDNGVYNLLIDKISTNDLLSNVLTEKTFTYSPLFNLTENLTTKNYLSSGGSRILQGTTTVDTTYDNDTNPSSYFIGKPTRVITTTSAYSDIFSTEENYIYNGYKLTRTKKKGNTGDNKFLVEDFVYDSLGNILQKTLSTSGITSTLAPRTVEYTYDTSSRFLKTTKDIEGLVSRNLAYHPIYGMVTESENPYGQRSKSEYDNWGKPTKITDYLGKSIVYTYSMQGNNYITKQVGDDGSESIKMTDALGRVIKTGAKNIDNSWSYKSVEYDYLGRKIKESEPFDGASASQWNTTTYDDYSRIISNTSATGLTTTINYNELTTTGSDGVKTTSSTKNANGHVVSVTDNGGMINYTYFANGNLKSSNFENTILTMEYDEFGRKSKLTDPSAGTYTYVYNYYGEMVKETSPKGTTTFEYDAFGKVIQKKIVGHNDADATDITTVYSYDNDTKQIISLSVTNPIDGNSNYRYTYDADKRLISVEENLPEFSYKKTIAYDEYGRVEKEQYDATHFASNKSTTKRVKNTYKNGGHWQTFDDQSSLLLWQTNTVNVKGQVTYVSLGNDLKEYFSYDNYGLPNGQSTVHTTPASNPNEEDVSQQIISLNYNFNAQRALLNNRSSSLFNTEETFTYDNQERLIKWEFAPQTLHDNNFTTSVDGFTSSGLATISTTVGKLRIQQVTTASDGAQKKILSNAKAGTKLELSANITKLTTNKIDIKIIEKNPTDNTVISQSVLATVSNNGVIRTNYTSLQNADIYVEFLKSTTSNDIGNASAFLIDDFLAKKLDSHEQQYDNKGRITQNEVGTYKYSIAKQYQNNSVVLTQQAKVHYTNYPRQEVSYNAFKSPIAIYEEGHRIVSFNYNTFQNRSKMEIQSRNPVERMIPRIKHYSHDGVIEIKHDLNSADVEFITYIGGDSYSAPVVYKSNGTESQFLYLHRDYLGSIIAISNQTGQIIEKRHFDAWGNVYKVANGENSELSNLTVLDRGYTSHEHLMGVGLIHMNGRLYDPMLHRFLQPDNYIQDPHNTQNYNRYGYAFNNPLKYTDPSGEEFFTAIVIGVGIGVATYLLSAIAVEAPITFDAIAQTVIFSCISSGATFGIGSATASIGNFFVRSAVQAVAHGTVQGGLSEVQGGKFCTGFYAGALSSAAASAWSGGNNYTYNQDGSIATSTTAFNGIGGNFAQSSAGTILFGTLAGGAGASLSGGNFWQGAATGAIVSGLNHVMHKGKWIRDLKERFHNINPDAKPEESINSVNEVLKDVDGLSNTYKISGRTPIDVTGQDSGAVLADTAPVDGKLTIKLYSGAFKSYFKLASTLFHEFFHAYQYNVGLVDYAQERFGVGAYYDSFGMPTKSQAWLESKAYDFQMRMGDMSSSVKSQYSMMLKHLK